MRENLDLSLTYILNDEGGFAIREDEPGGAVNRGISLTTLQEYWAKTGHPVLATISDLEALTEKEAREIYTFKFANPIKFDTLPGGVDYAMLNAAVMIGVTGARQLWLQAHTNSARETIDGILILLALTKLKSKSAGTFGKGWASRIQRVWNRTKDMHDGSNMGVRQ